MPKLITCPACSAPLDPGSGDSRRIRCAYCGNLLSTARTGSLSHLSAGARATPERQRGEPSRNLRLGVAAIVGTLVLLVVVGAVVAVTLFSRAPASGPPPALPALPSPSVSTRPAPAGAAPAGAAPALVFGAEGIGAGQFKDARSVAVDGEGRIYVGEYTGGRVQVFAPDGRFVTQFLVDTQPVLIELAADRKGRVYVVHPSRIVTYDGATGERLGEVPRVSKNRSDFYSGIFVALDGSLYAIGSNSDILHLSPSGALLATIESAARVGERVDFENVAVAGDGTIYALDANRCEVFKFAPDGRYVSRWGGRGTAPGLFLAADDVAVDGSGRVYVSGSMRGIQVFDSNGRYLETLGDQLVFGMAIDDAGAVFACERNQHRVAKYVRAALTPP
jgi:sugar lactone lactonase YvrE